MNAEPWFIILIGSAIGIAICHDYYIYKIMIRDNAKIDALEREQEGK